MGGPEVGVHMHSCDTQCNYYMHACLHFLSICFFRLAMAMAWAHFFGGATITLVVVLCVLALQGAPHAPAIAPVPTPAPVSTPGFRAEVPTDVLSVAPDENGSLGVDKRIPVPTPAPASTPSFRAEVPTDVLSMARDKDGSLGADTRFPVLRGLEKMVQSAEYMAKFEPPLRKNSIAVILTQYLRPYIRQQLEGLQKQTLRPDHIYIVQNAPEEHIRKMIRAGTWSIPSISKLLKDFPEVRHLDYRNLNSKFFGRFALPLILRTDYVMIIDDDLVPGPKYIEETLKLSLQHNAIVCETGRLFRPDPEDPGNGSNFSVGVVTAPLEIPVEVDFGGHIWFLKREWIHYMWALEPVSLLTCEDAHLSISAYLLGNITTYIPAQPKGQKQYWGASYEVHKGRDIVAQSKNRARYPQGTRTEILRYWVRKGWRPAVTRGITTKYKVWWMDEEMKKMVGY